MATLLFRLNGVDTDEAEEVRQLLDNNAVRYYETDAGRFGLSVAAIWLQDDTQLTTARQLLDTYRDERQQRMQQAYAEAKARGEAPTLWGRFLHDPFRFLFIVGAAGLILYLSLAPFLGLV